MKTIKMKLYGVGCNCCDGIVQRQYGEGDTPTLCVSENKEAIESLAKDLKAEVVEFLAIYQRK